MKHDDSSRGLSPTAIGFALTASAAVWVFVDLIRRFL
jgi:hypothetical protein